MPQKLVISWTGSWNDIETDALWKAHAAKAIVEKLCKSSAMISAYLPRLDPSSAYFGRYGINL